MQTSGTHHSSEWRAHLMGLLGPSHVHWRDVCKNFHINQSSTLDFGVKRRKIHPSRRVFFHSDGESKCGHTYKWLLIKFSPRKSDCGVALRRRRSDASSRPSAARTAHRAARGALLLAATQNSIYNLIPSSTIKPNGPLSSAECTHTHTHSRQT